MTEKTVTAVEVFSSADQEASAAEPMSAFIYKQFKHLQPFGSWE